MGLATTLTDIANLALSSIGEKVITNILDEGEIESKIRIHLFESIRQTQLEIFWQDLLVNYNPTSQGNYLETTLQVYNLPNNFLDIVDVSGNAGWFLEGGKLITSSMAPTVKYKRYSEEPTEWSGYMVELIYRRLAANVAPTITQNGQIAQLAAGAYEKARLDNLTRSANRARKFKQRTRVYGNLRSRAISGNRWPYVGGQR